MGRTATFILEGRQANLEFASTVVALLARTDYSCAVLDLDAFYSSNSDRIFAHSASAAKTTIRVPKPDSDIEEELSRLFGARSKIVVIDSLNSLYHLLSVEDGSSRSRRLAFAMAGLSYLARTNTKAVILTMYRREGFTRSGTGSSISGLSDVTASVEIRGPELFLRSERGSGWPGGRFSTRIPSR